MKTRQVFASYDNRNATPTEYFYCPVDGSRLSDTTASGKRRCGVCGFVDYRNPMPGTVVLIMQDGKVLLGRRAGRSYLAGKWCLPGGFIEHDEDFLSAAIREAKEETGYDIRTLSILSVVSNFFNKDRHTLVIVVLAEIAGGTPVPGDDIDELGWFDPAGPFPDMAFDADEHIVRRYLQTNLSGVPIDPEYAGGAIDCDVRGDIP